MNAGSKCNAIWKWNHVFSSSSSSCCCQLPLAFPLNHLYNYKLRVCVCEFGIWFRHHPMFIMMTKWDGLFVADEIFPAQHHIDGIIDIYANWSTSKSLVYRGPLPPHHRRRHFVFFIFFFFYSCHPLLMRPNFQPSEQTQILMNYDCL